ncbi:Splicing factor 3B subunit 6-like protein [Grifola frondosa]|uniref:Splicing factor 3B subunit 6-like protein n=1 Tax=Grifola frondosa TaxID=5627 RepID=A0A1C7MIP8_GRIFR|nr:Splicing factor 3B subunit 6-like protein [Grifola frondosa]
MTSFAQQTFVLFIVDPDAPTPQNATEAQFRHLLAQDLQTNGSLGSGALLVNTSAALTEFVMPTPPAGSDPHRYVILLFVQPSNFTTVAPNFVNASTPRNNFNLTTFSQEVGLGSPVAGNFFLTGPDNSTNTTSAPVPSATATNPPTTSTASSATKVTDGSILGVIMIACAVALEKSKAYFPIWNLKLRGLDPHLRLRLPQTSTFSNLFNGVSTAYDQAPPGANRILFVKNLNYQITGEDLYDLFGRYGSIRQIRIGDEQKTRGTAFVVFDDVMDAKNALDHLNGFHLQERYIVVLYHMPAKQDAAAAKADLARREEELSQLKKKHDIKDED